jgi:hypothetical protein
MRSYTPRRIVRQRTLSVSGELLWQQSRRKLLPHPGAPASTAGALFFLEPRLLGPFWLKHSATNCVYGYEQGGNRSATNKPPPELGPAASTAPFGSFFVCNSEP